MSFFNRSLVNRFSLDTLLKISTFIAFLCALWLAIDCITGFGELWGIVIPMFLFSSTNGIIGSCSNAAALAKAPDEITGSAAALLGSMQYGSGFVSSLLLAIFSDGTPVGMGVIIAVSALLSFGAAFYAAALNKAEEKHAGCEEMNAGEEETRMDLQRENV